MDDATTSTSLHSSPRVLPTSSRHRHEQFQRLQHHSNVPTSASSSPPQRNSFNSILLFSIIPTRPFSIKRLVNNVLLDYRRSPNASATSTRAASTTTSCCCPLLLHRRRRRLLDFIDVPSTPKGPTLLVLASTTSRQRQARSRATAASFQCSRRHLRNR